jgi:hypothetical protein
VLAGGVLGDGVEIVIRKEYMEFVVVVVCVSDYRHLAFVSSGNYHVPVGDFLVNLL